MASQFISNNRAREEEPVEFLNDLFRQAANDKVADIHFHRTEKDCRVKLRIPGGALIPHKSIPPEWMQVIDEKIRAKAQVSTTDRRTPQDGRLSLDYDDGRVGLDVRVAITPGVDPCQLIVCRLLNQANAGKSLDDIEMSVMVKESLRRAIIEPHGLFLVCGPTGSGKTTTLYALLNELNDDTRNIVTVENPVECRIPQFHQINVDGTSMTFASALRTVLRQDPDVVMVGEIRDLETANIAVQAAMTGHLVLSTIHANNAPLAIARLVTMGIDPSLLTSALRGVIAQRLVRTIAPHADVVRLPPNDREKAWLRLNRITRKYGEGYPHVDPYYGYKGAAPLMEVIMVDPRVQKAIAAGEAAIYEEAARQPQFETLAHAAERLAYSGRTTIDEALRLLSGQDAPNIQTRRLGQVLVEQETVGQEAMDRALEKQSALRTAGEHKRLGSLLIEQGLCTQEDIYRAIGFTAEANDVLLRIATTDEEKQRVHAMALRWVQGTTSLFDIAISAGFTTLEGIHDAYVI